MHDAHLHAADDVVQDMPEYMKMSLDEAVRRYKDMAVPLRAYARYLTEENIPNPESKPEALGDESKEKLIL